MNADKEYSPIKLKDLIESWNIGSLFMYVNFACLTFIYWLIGNKRDGWRKTTEANHRNEASRYLGNISNIAYRYDSVPASDPELVHEIYSVIASQKNRYGLDWNSQAAKLTRWEPIDLCIVTYKIDGALTNLRLFPDPKHPMEGSLTSNMIESWLCAFNETIHKSEKIRPLLLRKRFLKRVLKEGLSEKQSNEVFNRFFRATWINHTTYQTDEHRSIPWMLNHVSSPGGGVIDFECRRSESMSTYDLWIKISHIAIDGRFGRKLLKSIRMTFGKESVSRKFVERFDFMQVKTPNQEIYHGGGFLDFSQLIHQKRELERQGISTAITTLMAWHLGIQPYFGRTKFNIPVDIPAREHQDATLGFVFVRPAWFRQRSRSFVEFNDFINRQISDLQNRVGAGYILVQSAAILPPLLNNLINNTFMSHLIQEVTGHISFTFMPTIEMVYPTLSDNIGAAFVISLPAEETTAFIGIRSSQENIREIYQSLADMLSNCEVEL